MKDEEVVYKKIEAFSDELNKHQKPIRNNMSATVGRGSRTFENKKAIGEAIMADRSAAPRVVAFEQVLAKNRIRPMTSYNSGSNTVMSRQAVNNFGGQFMSRVKSAKIMPDSA